MDKVMRKYKLWNGESMLSELTAEKITQRMEDLDWLRVITEGYESGEGKSICNKAVRALKVRYGFTGIIRLTKSEKEFLSYILNENSMLMNVEKAVLEKYIGIKRPKEIWTINSRRKAHLI